jgi:hypothetical protein
MWTLSPRPPSKTTETPAEPLSTPTKPPSPPKPPAPRKDGKPPQPYPAPPDQYWRWNTKTAGYMDDADLVEAVRYVLEILRSNGMDDPLAFIGEVEALAIKEAKRQRRLQRLAAFK